MATLTERIQELRRESPKDHEGMCKWRSDQYPMMSLKTGPYDVKDRLTSIDVTLEESKPECLLIPLLEHYGSERSMHLRVSTSPERISFDINNKRFPFLFDYHSITTPHFISPRMKGVLEIFGIPYTRNDKMLIPKTYGMGHIDLCPEQQSKAYHFADQFGLNPTIGHSTRKQTAMVSANSKSHRYQIVLSDVLPAEVDELGTFVKETFGLDLCALSYESL